jgi:hypothetical protein
MAEPRVDRVDDDGRSRELTEGVTVHDVDGWNAEERRPVSIPLRGNR